MADPNDVWRQIMDVRERIAHIESSLMEIRRVLDQQPRSSGSLVIPVSLAVVLVQGAFALVQHFT